LTNCANRVQTAGVPHLARLGMAVLALGLLADLIAHATALDPTTGHVVVLVGMLAVVASVATQGLRTSNSARERTLRLRAHW
jgi:hypothetical protein